MVERVDRKTKPDELSAVYSDFSINFNAHPNTGNLVMRNNVDAIKRSLRNLILTEFGERFFHPEIGCGLRNILFEPATAINKRQLQLYITESIENFEPRVSLKDVVVETSEDEETYIIDIYFNMINNSETQALNVKLDRVR